MSKSPPELLGLPRELQDVIFSLAYPPNLGATFVSRSSWEAREMERRLDDRRSVYVPKAFPSPKVAEFMVSKDYFVSAAKVYIRHYGDTVSASTSDVSLSRIMTREGIGFAFLKSITVVGWVEDDLSDMPNLQRLTMEITALTFFGGIEPKHICLE
ncbi:hypothetical protein LTR08_007919 [Meristemomyces frigidus]|nr:hypothetical protein LTR08_007919 [Meristemomyces frigidus]